MSKAVKIKDFPEYYITDTGQVYCRKATRNRTGRIKKLQPQLTKKGYLKIGLSKNNCRKFFLIHRLVAEAFIKKPANSEVNHINGIKT